MLTPFLSKFVCWGPLAFGPLKAWRCSMNLTVHVHSEYLNWHNPKGECNGLDLWRYDDKTMAGVTVMCWFSHF